jgi:hypothetical protein
VSVRDILSEELDIVSSDEVNSESEGKCPSDESSNTLTESETSVCTNGWEDALLAPNFRAKQLAQWLCGDLKSPLRPGCSDFSNTVDRKGLRS